MYYTDELFLRSNNNNFIQYIEDTLSMLEDRITRLGTGYTHYWYISAACGLLRSTIKPSEAIVQKQQAIDRVARQYYRILASQEDFLKAKEKILPARLSKVGADTSIWRILLTITQINASVDLLQVPGNMTNGSGLSFFDTSLPQV